MDVFGIGVKITQQNIFMFQATIIVFSKYFGVCLY